MKKILSFVLMLLGGVAMLTSCSTDRDSNPDIKSPTTFTINESPVAGMHILLSPTNNVNLTWSQPDYGYNAFATYNIQVGVVNNGTVTWNEKDGAPKYLSTTYTECNANISGAEIAEAICEIDGFKDVDSYVDMGYREIAMRVYACINTSMRTEVEGTGILSSNYVTFQHMAAYNAVRSPAYIYLVGNCTGDWATPNAGNADLYANWRLYENDDEIGSNVYHGTFDLPAGDLQFRFYKALTGWNDDTMGPQKDDNGVPSSFVNGVYEGTVTAGQGWKGTWLFSGFEGGLVEMTVDLNQGTVKFVQQ